MSSPLAAAATSLAVTFVLWFGAALAGFALFGASVGWALRRLIPPAQQRFPRRLWVLGCLVAGLVFGAVAGLHVGAAEGALAFGDALAEGGGVHVLPPWPQDRGEGWAAAAVADLEEVSLGMDAEASELVTGGPLAYLVTHVLLRHLMDPVQAIRTFGRAYLAERAAGADALRRLGLAWRDARPELEFLATRKVALALLGGCLYFILCVLAGLVLLAASYAEVRRVAAAGRPTSGTVATLGLLAEHDDSPCPADGAEAPADVRKDGAGAAGAADAPAPGGAGAGRAMAAHAVAQTRPA